MHKDLAVECLEQSDSTFVNGIDKEEGWVFDKQQVIRNI